MSMDKALAALREHWKHKEFRKAQKIVIEFALDGNDVLAILPTGGGKCLSPSTPVLRFDGDVVSAGEVQEGDKLMGPDGRVRRVLATHSGRSRMVRVVPNRGEPFLVTDDHILTLVRTASGRVYPSDRGGVIVDVSIREWRKWSKSKRHLHKLFHVGVGHFGYARRDELPVDPYLLGALLGDGTMEQYRLLLTCPDKEVLVACTKAAARQGVRVVRGMDGNCPFLRFTKAAKYENDPTVPHVLLAALEELELRGVTAESKHVPSRYLTAPPEVRLQMLAGLLDTDGHTHQSTFEFSSKSLQLARDVAFLARSLGLYASAPRPCGPGHAYHRVHIGGDTRCVPLRVVRKHPARRTTRINALRTGFKVEPGPDGPYSGFQVDGDGRFLLGDFTVTHNSACFQIPALVSEGGAIVISPLIALMKDQVDDCASRGIPATYINSHVDDDEREERISDFIAGAYKLLYIAPERLNNPKFLQEIARATVSYIVVDEAHCCSEWGHDFRPDYMRINRIVRALTKRGGVRPPILALTATATELVVRDIAISLELSPDHALVIGDPLRPNITYEIEDATQSSARAFQIAHEIIADMDIGDGRHVIYANTRKMAEKLVEMSAENHGSGRAAFYHAGMKKEEREAVQDAFKDGSVPIVCATTAFGMGVDVPNIRTVLNFGIPASLEAYVQQCGRAGRDGKPSNAIVIVDDYSIRFQRMLIEGANPPWQLYGTVWDYLHSQLQPDTTLRKTVREMTGEIISLTRTSIQEEQVSVILGGLHSKGLIDKRPVEAGTPLSFDVRQFDETLRSASPKPFVRRVWEELWTRYVKVELAKPGMEAEREVTVYVNKHVLQAEAGIASASTVNKAIESLQGRGLTHLGQTYTGNIIGIRKWRADINTELPREKIEAKRASDVSRFHAMLRYTEIREPSQRAEFLRDYFLKPVNAA